MTLTNIILLGDVEIRSTLLIQKLMFLSYHFAKTFNLFFLVFFFLLEMVGTFFFLRLKYVFQDCQETENILKGAFTPTQVKDSPYLLKYYELDTNFYSSPS